MHSRVMYHWMKVIVNLLDSLKQFPLKVRCLWFLFTTHNHCINFSILINLHADYCEFTCTSLDDEVCLKVAVVYFITTSMLVHVRFVSALGFFFPQIKHESLPLLFILPFYTMVVSDLGLFWVER